MQEEVTGKTVTLIVNGAKMSEPISRSATRISRPLPMWRRNTMWILP